MDFYDVLKVLGRGTKYRLSRYFNGDRSNKKYSQLLLVFDVTQQQRVKSLLKGVI